MRWSLIAGVIKETDGFALDLANGLCRVYSFTSSLLMVYSPHVHHQN